MLDRVGWCVCVCVRQGSFDSRSHRALAHTHTDEHTRHACGHTECVCALVYACGDRGGCTRRNVCTRAYTRVYPAGHYNEHYAWCSRVRCSCVRVCVCIIMCGRWCSASTDDDDMEELKYEYYNVRACVRTCICECCSLCVRAHGHEDGWKRSDWQRWHWGRIQSPDISLQPLRLSLSLCTACAAAYGAASRRA